MRGLRPPGCAKGAATDAIDAAGDALAAVDPKLRGVSHEWALFLWLGLGAALIIAADTPKATLAVAIYAVSLSDLLGTSALYHRMNSKRPNVRRSMSPARSLDDLLPDRRHLRALALLVLNRLDRRRDPRRRLVRRDRRRDRRDGLDRPPKWVAALIYLSLGWVAVLAFPGLWSEMGVTGTMLVAAGGLLYTAAPSSTRPRGPTRAPASSATTRSSTPSSSPPPPPSSRPSPSSPCPPPPAVECWEMTP